MRVAFKEWAIVVDALLGGSQMVILRKGGIREGPGGFQVQYPAFLLFPTLFHQQRHSVVPRAQRRFDEISTGFPPPHLVRIEGWAEVAAWHRVESLAQARRLEPLHIWKEDVIAQRFAWGRDQNIVALALRLFRLPQAIERPARPQYGGCKSWVELESDIDTRSSIPVLSEPVFRAHLEQFHRALS